MVGDYLHPKAGIFSPGHLLGTDDSGRDVLSRVDLGRARVAAHRGRLGRCSARSIGGFLGLVAGFKGRLTDTVLSAVFNIFLAFPQLVLALTLVSVLAPQRDRRAARRRASGPIASVVVILAVGIVSIPVLGRITRASALLVVATRVRHGRARAGRDRQAGDVPRGAPERRARDVVDRAARCRGRDRARRCARGVRRRASRSPIRRGAT